MRYYLDSVARRYRKIYFKECKLLRPHAAAKRRAHCASAKLASAASGAHVYAYDSVYISHMVYCHTEYMNVCLWLCVCVRVYVCERVCGRRRASYEHGAAAFFPSEKVKANPNRPALNAAPHPGLRIDKLNGTQNFCRDCTCKGQHKLTE